MRSIKRLNPSQSDAIQRYLSGIDHEIYGSSAQAAWGSRLQRSPADLDVAVRNVRKSAYYLITILERYRDGNQYRLKFKPEYGSAYIEMFDPQKKMWDTIIDIQPLNDHKSQKPDAIRLKGNGKYPDPYADKSSGPVTQQPISAQIKSRCKPRLGRQKKIKRLKGYGQSTQRFCRIRETEKRRKHPALGLERDARHRKKEKKIL